MSKETAKKTKVMTIFGTRPEIIRLSRIFSKLDKYVHHLMVHTGQSYDYEMNKIFFDELQLRKPDYFLDVKAETLGKQIANIIFRSEEVIKKELPDAILILGDTNSALSAIVAKRFKIPIFHMEAGNRCFDDNVPEETNRKIADHISDINLPYTENSRRYLIQEGIHPGTIFVTGSPLAEVLSYYEKKIEAASILKELNLKKKGYFLVSAHREENVTNKKKLDSLVRSLNFLAGEYKKPLIFSVHPRTRICLKENNINIHRLIKFHKPFGYFDYVNLQKNAFCVLSDSGTIQEESGILKFPAIQIRNSSERPEAFDAGIIILSGLKKESIAQAIDIVVSQSEANEKFVIPESYKDTNVSSKVLRIIISFLEQAKNKYNH